MGVIQVSVSAMTLLLVTDIMSHNSTISLGITQHILVHGTDSGLWGVLGGIFFITDDIF